MRSAPAVRVAALAAFAVCGTLAARLAARSWSSVVAYVAPYRFEAGEESTGPALAPRVVMVLVDGLRLDASRRMAFLNTLRAQGADFDSSAGVPSYSRPGRAALGTGAWAEIHGATTNFHDKAVDVDNLF